MCTVTHSYALENSKSSKYKKSFRVLGVRRVRKKIEYFIYLEYVKYFCRDDNISIFRCYFLIKYTIFKYILSSFYSDDNCISLVNYFSKNVNVSFAYFIIVYYIFIVGGFIYSALGILLVV